MSYGRAGLGRLGVGPHPQSGSYTIPVAGRPIAPPITRPPQAQPSQPVVPQPAVPVRRPGMMPLIKPPPGRLTPIQPPPLQPPTPGQPSTGQPQAQGTPGVTYPVSTGGVTDGLPIVSPTAAGSSFNLSLGDLGGALSSPTMLIVGIGAAVVLALLEARKKKSAQVVAA